MVPAGYTASPSREGQHRFLWEVRHSFQRHAQTVAWMVVGLLLSSEIAWTKWAPYIINRAHFAQGTQRRFERWLHNRRIFVMAVATLIPVCQGSTVVAEGKRRMVDPH